MSHPDEATDGLGRLDDDLIELLAEERAQPGPSPERFRAIESRLLVTVGLGTAAAMSGAAAQAAGGQAVSAAAAAATTAGHVAAGAAGLALGKTVVAVVAGGALLMLAAGGVWRTEHGGVKEKAIISSPAVLTRPSGARLVPAPAPPVPVTAPPSAAPRRADGPSHAVAGARPEAFQQLRAQEPVPVIEAPAAADATSPPPSVRANAGALAEERAFIEAARAKLVAGDAAATLERVERHGREFPAGALGDEADVLRVLALVRLDRAQEAARVVEELRARKPGSLFLPSLEAALGQAQGAAHDPSVANAGLPAPR